MQSSSSSIDAFFALLKAGLWERSVQLLPYEPLDFEALYRIADEQAVVGVLAAGLEFVEDRRITKQEAMPFLKGVVSTENRNSSMNKYIESLVIRMRRVGIYSLLIKGQGVAQCYARPQWRASGDIDLFLNSQNYKKAKDYLSSIGDSVEPEGIYSKHLGIKIDSWTVELHGTLRCGLSKAIDNELDAIQDDTFISGNVRTWRNGETDVFLPAAGNDVLIIFTHILSHYLKGGIGLRQICDWCRLLYAHRDSIDIAVLRQRIQNMRLMSEWKAFAAFAVNYLGMPPEMMPLYDSSQQLTKKAYFIRSFILKVGNFGKKRDMSYYDKYPYIVRKIISFGRRIGDLCRHVKVSPIDSLRFFPSIVFNGVRSATRGE